MGRVEAYIENTAGRVSLRSKDPRACPLIEFRYFSEGNDQKQADLDAVVDDVDFAGKMNKGPSGGEGLRELVPGRWLRVGNETPRVRRSRSVGPYASCSNRMGPDGDDMAVLDSRVRMRGIDGLRVADASVFPRIPGYFIVTPVYMISEPGAARAGGLRSLARAYTIPARAETPATKGRFDLDRVVFLL